MGLAVQARARPGGAGLKRTTSSDAAAAPRPYGAPPRRDEGPSELRGGRGIAPGLPRGLVGRPARIRRHAGLLNIRLSRGLRNLSFASFDEFDLDGSGDISLEELERAIYASYDRYNQVSVGIFSAYASPPSQVKIKEYFDRFDEDGSGALSRGEYRRLTEAILTSPTDSVWAKSVTGLLLTTALHLVLHAATGHDMSVDLSDMAVDTALSSSSLALERMSLALGHLQAGLTLGAGLETVLESLPIRHLASLPWDAATPPPSP